jgi:hypothetical protein
MQKIIFAYDSACGKYFLPMTQLSGKFFYRRLSGQTIFNDDSVIATKAR